jgi:hypothetical protein
MRLGGMVYGLKVARGDVELRLGSVMITALNGALIVEGDEWCWQRHADGMIETWNRPPCTDPEAPWNVMRRPTSGWELLPAL